MLAQALAPPDAPPPESLLPWPAPTWAALRCHALQTLDLADRLTATGLGAWAPRLAIRRRVPRRRKTELRTAALLPSFVFVPYPQADQAIDLGRLGTVPRNWPFLFNGQRPALPAAQLVALKMAEGSKPGVTYPTGSKVRVLYGPLHGACGTIVGRKSKDHWLVEIQGLRQRVLLPGFLLQSI